jgi:hypothetical protein
MARLLKPIDRPAKSVPQGDLRLKSIGISKFLAITAKPLHFAVGRAQPLRVALGLCIAAHKTRDYSKEFPNRDFLIRANVKDFAETVVQGRHR